MTLSAPKGVGITVAVIAITPAAVNDDMPIPASIGYRIAINIMAKLEALGITNDIKLPTKKTIGTNKVLD